MSYSVHVSLFTLRVAHDHVLTSPLCNASLQVSGLSPETSEEKVKDFFLFCGAITSLKKQGNTADITFQRPSAARTALMLNGGTVSRRLHLDRVLCLPRRSLMYSCVPLPCMETQLDGAHLEVTAPELSESAGLPKDAKGSTPIGAATEDDHLAQEDKPKAGIMAECESPPSNLFLPCSARLPSVLTCFKLDLAAGYNISDSVIQQAIEFDHKQGISAKFLEYFNKLDNKIGSTVAHQPEAKATELLQGQVHAVANKAKEIDQQRGFTSFLWDYYSKAINTNTGQK